MPTHDKSESSNGELTKDEKRNGKKRWALLLLLLGFLILGVSMVSMYLSNDAQMDHKGGIPTSETALQKIINDDMTKEERQAAVNEQVANGYMNVNFSPYATFDASGTSVDFTLTNSHGNNHDVVFEILNADDEVIYKSAKVPTGYEVKEVVLSKPLPAGIYENYRVRMGYGDNGNVVSSFPLTIQAQ